MSVLLIIVSPEFSKVTGAELALKKEFFFHAHTPVVKLFFYLLYHMVYFNIFASDLEECGFKTVDDTKFSSYKML